MSTYIGHKWFPQTRESCLSVCQCPSGAFRKLQASFQGCGKGLLSGHSIMKPRVLQRFLTFWNFLYPRKVLWGRARVTFKFLVMSFTENLFFLLLLGSGRWTAQGSSLPQISWCNPASDLGGFYSDVHGELWLLISMRGLFQINQISFRRTQIKVQKHLRDDEEQHKALSAKVQGPYQSLLMSVEHFRCTCSEVSKTSCREILYFLTTAD